jgi:hypothetical protein
MSRPCNVCTRDCLCCTTEHRALDRCSANLRLARRCHHRADGATLSRKFDLCAVRVIQAQTLKNEQFVHTHCMSDALIIRWPSQSRLGFVATSPRRVPSQGVSIRWEDNVFSDAGPCGGGAGCCHRSARLRGREASRRLYVMGDLGGIWCKPRLDVEARTPACRHCRYGRACACMEKKL